MLTNLPNRVILINAHFDSHYIINTGRVYYKSEYVIQTLVYIAALISVLPLSLPDKILSIQSYSRLRCSVSFMAIR